jgi:hypothetical protein
LVLVMFLSCSMTLASGAGVTPPPGLSFTEGLCLGCEAGAGPAGGPGGDPATPTPAGRVGA